jgi:hypothetical protein
MAILAVTATDVQGLGTAGFGELCLKGFISWIPLIGGAVKKFARIMKSKNRNRGSTCFIP